MVCSADVRLRFPLRDEPERRGAGGAWLPAVAGAYGRVVSRLPFPSRDQLGAEGQAVWDSVVASRGSQAVSDQGRMTGPFNAFVQAPDVGRHLEPLGAVVRFGTSVERRLAEIAIMTVAAHWKAEYEWHAHARMARGLGVPEAVIDAIARGDDPPLAGDDERSVYTVARHLTETGRLSQDVYDAAHRLLGDAGVVELISMCGYYTLVSFILNAFAVPLPPGTQPQWGQRVYSAPTRALDRTFHSGEGSPACAAQGTRHWILPILDSEPDRPGARGWNRPGLVLSWPRRRYQTHPRRTTGTSRPSR